MTPRSFLLAALLAATALSAAPVAPSPAAGQESAYDHAIEKRTDGIVAALNLQNPTVRARAHDAIVDQYHALNAWQAAHEAALQRLEKARGDAAARAETARIMATRRVLHDRFLARLAAVLTPAQIEKVEDKMTYNKVKVTYDAYCQIIPGLTDVEKARILALLQEARDQAIDGVSAAEKSAIFKRYKGRINIYLSAQGINVSQAYKDWGRRQKARAASTRQ